MNNTDGKHNKILITLVSLLVIVVAIQSFFLFRAYNPLSEFLHMKQPELKSLFEKNAPLPAPGNAVPLFNDKWLNKPFDPDKWNPFNEMEQMQQHMNQMFDNAFERFGMSTHFQNEFQQQAFSPNLDMKDEDDRYVVQLDLPGVNKANIDVRVEGQVLTVKGKREEDIEQKAKDGQAEVHERRMGEFERSITLPDEVDANRMETNYENGVLTIILPKAKP